MKVCLSNIWLPLGNHCGSVLVTELHDIKLTGPFENYILYKMCSKYSDHTCSHVTAGKIVAIGRIYAANPARGAGKGRLKNKTLAEAIGEKLQKSEIDQKIKNLCETEFLSKEVINDLVDVHAYLVQIIALATREWSQKSKEPDWKPKNQHSFATKYLHFHRPKIFPIMDSIVRAGLGCRGFRKSTTSYETFCREIIEFAVKKEKDVWFLRSIDTELLKIGNQHIATKQKGICKSCVAFKKV